MSVEDAVSKAILGDNYERRQGRAPVRALDHGEVTFKIPKKHYYKLLRTFPELASKDHAVRLQAWHRLRNSPLGEQYLVTRTPRQVKNSQRGIIVK